MDNDKLLDGQNFVAFVTVFAMSTVRLSLMNIFHHLW